MRFLVDAHLPQRVASALKEWGHDAVHTGEMPAGNATKDSEICSVADAEDRIVITKDSDFVDSFMLHGTPANLLLISTGNISNNELIELLQNHIADLEVNFSSSNFIELSRSNLIVHE